jgi:hypothetical protein
MGILWVEFHILADTNLSIHAAVCQAGVESLHSIFVTVGVAEENFEGAFVGGRHGEGFPLIELMKLYNRK